MLRPLQRWLLRGLAHLFSEATATKAARWLSRPLVEQLRTQATDDFLETLLRAMDVAFCLSPSYRRTHLPGFQARYVFTTDDGRIGATARFAGGDMKVDHQAASDYTTRIRFKDGAALLRFLLAGDQDVLNSLLANDVAIDGNVNYIYKLGFMAQDLQQRLGLGAPQRVAP